METPTQNNCTLSNEHLLIRCTGWVSSLCKSGGKSWCLKVPVDFNNDPDMLFTELGKRFHEANQLAASKDEKIKQLEDAITAILSNKHFDLGDAIYKVRESEGKGWEGKWVKHWGQSVEKLKLLVKK